MPRQFRTVNYDSAIDITVRLGDCLPPEHLACFIVNAIALMDLKCFYARYGSRGGPAYAPEILLGLLLYGYATGLFSSRQIEKATYESLPFRFIAGDWHPDHDTIAYFRKIFLHEIKTLFVEVLLIAYESGVLKLGNISLDGTKIHADASKSKAVSYQRLGDIVVRLERDIEELLALADQPEQGKQLPAGLMLNSEIVRRQGRLQDLTMAKTVIEARAQARYAVELAAYEEKMQQRAQKIQLTGRKLPGRPPSPPTPGPRPKDQYNFTDPDSQIMKNSNNRGFDQHYNAQVAIGQDSLLIVGYSLSNHTTDQAEVDPTLDTIPVVSLGTPTAAALDAGYFSQSNIAKIEARQIAPYIATGRDSHSQSWAQRFAQTPEPPPEDASPKVKMAYKLRTEIGKAIYRLRKCTVEPVIGIIKETLGFRQFSLRGLQAVSGEWALICIAFNLKRLHALTEGQLPPRRISPTGC